MIKKREIRYALLTSTVVLSFIGCGEVIDKVEDRPAPPANKSHYLDSNVSGLHYKATYECHHIEDKNSTSSKEVCQKSIEGTTYNGVFGFIPGGDGVELSVAGLKLDYIPQKYLLMDSVLTVKKTDGKLASFLQSMDSDANASNGINISKEVVDALRDLNVSKYGYIDNYELNIEELVKKVQEKLDANAPEEETPTDNNETTPSNDQNESTPQKLHKSSITLKFVPEDKALEHLRNTISTNTTPPSITVEKVIDDIKDIVDNAKEYSQEEIEEKVKALRTTLNNPLEGDRGLTDIEIAKTLLDLSELTNEGYLEDIFDFKGSVKSHLSQIIKQMALDGNLPEKQHIVLAKDENMTNVVANSKKAIASIVEKLKIISNKLGASLATAPQYYRFKYEGIDISLDNIQALRSVLLATASKLSLTLAYNLGKDGDYTPKIYTDKDGNKYEYQDINIHMDKMLNREGFGVATNQSALTKAKDYLKQSTIIIKDLSAYKIRGDLDETLINTSEEVNDNQEIIDYATKLYKVLVDNNGTFTITDEDNKEEYEIAINNLFDISKVVRPSDFGSGWKYTCEDDFNITTEEKSKIFNDVRCYNSYDDYSADLKPTKRVEAKDSKLDDLIVKIVLNNGSVTKTGQELINYIVPELAKQDEETSSPNNDEEVSPQDNNETSPQDNNETSSPKEKGHKGNYLDSKITGVDYKAVDKCHWTEDKSKKVCEKKIEGTTNNGVFEFIPGGEGVKFYVAGLLLDYIPQKYLVDDSFLIVREEDKKLASFLQSMDSDANATNGINISKEVVEALTDLNVSKYSYIGNSELNVEELVKEVQAKLKKQKSSITLNFVPEDKALEHLRNTISTYTIPPSITVEKVIDDIKDIVDNAKEYSQEEIEEKVKALRTTLNNPLEGDRGLTDIEIAKTLLDLSELTNEGYLEDVFDFKGSVDSHLSQIIKEMALDRDNNLPDDKHIVRAKEENSTNIVADSKKAIASIVEKLKTISDNLGDSLSTAPQYYRFKYEGIDISLDNIQALRSVLLATASKLSLTLAYNIGKDEDYIPKIYKDRDGYKYEYQNIEINKDKILNREGFGVATNQAELDNAKNYLKQSAMIIKDLSAYKIREDLNETLTNTPEEANDNQEIIDYATKLYKSLLDNNGTFTIVDEHGGKNGEREEITIAINRLFSTSTAVKTSDFGTDFAYERCPNDFNISTDDEVKKYGSRFCYPKDLSHEDWKWDYSHYCELDVFAKTQPSSETSGLDELITKIKVGEELKEAEEVIQYLEFNSSGVRSHCGIPSYSPSSPEFTYEKVAGKTYYPIDESGQHAGKAVFSALGTNTVRSSEINETSSNEITFSIENGKLIFDSGDFRSEHTLLQEYVNGRYDIENVKTYNSGELVYEANHRLYYQKSDAEAFLGEKRNFKYIGSDTSILTAPNGGEVVRTNDNVSITWNHDKILTSGVKLYVLDDDPTDLYSYSTLTDLKSNKKWSPIGNSIEDNDGSYTPTTEELSDRSGNNYIILITSEDENDWDISDSTFSINP